MMTNRPTDRRTDEEDHTKDDCVGGQRRVSDLRRLEIDMESVRSI